MSACHALAGGCGAILLPVSAALLGLSCMPHRLAAAQVVVLSAMLAACAGPAAVSEPAPVAGPPATALAPGTHLREIPVGGLDRTYLVHIPPVPHARPLPVVLAFHGATMSAGSMARMTGLNEKADREGFIVVYPNALGRGVARGFNVSRPAGEGSPDDVGFVRAVLDDLPTVAWVDPTRVYATGFSNGGMLCYRLAAEMADRIAAIAPVAGTMAMAEAEPSRAVPVLHIHGTADTIVPFTGPGALTPSFLSFKSAHASVAYWAEVAGLTGKPEVSTRPTGDGFEVTRTAWGAGRPAAEVALVAIEGVGHAWPGRPPIFRWMGPSTLALSANDLMWSFFERHRLSGGGRESGETGSVKAAE